MPDTLSTAETTKLVNTVIPTYLDGSVITDEGSLAYLAGALFQAGEFFSRTGAFESLWLHGVAVAGSKTAVDSMDAVYFASGLLADNSDNEYSFMNPVPPTVTRVATYDAASAAQGTPKFTKAAEAIGSLDSTDFIVNPFKVREADRDFANSLSSIIQDTRLKAELLKACKGSGRALVALIRDKAAAATPKEKTLAYTEWQAYAMRPFVGELTLASFEAYYDEYDKLRNRVGEAIILVAAHFGRLG